MMLPAVELAQITEPGQEGHGQPAVLAACAGLTAAMPPGRLRAPVRSGSLPTVSSCHVVGVQCTGKRAGARGRTG
jgi:hypothetical protein